MFSGRLDFLHSCSPCVRTGREIDIEYQTWKRSVLNTPERAVLQSAKAPRRWQRPQDIFSAALVRLHPWYWAHHRIVEVGKTAKINLGYSRGIALRIVGAHGRVRDLLRADGLEDKVGSIDRTATVDKVLLVSVRQTG